MTPEPFLQMRVRGYRDLLRVRHRARQIAKLLRFGPEEVIAIAAASFMVAHQGFVRLGRAFIAFTLHDRCLRVSTSPATDGDVLPPDLFVLQKPLPPEQPLAAEDITWLLGQIQQLAPTRLGEEIARQNQEVLQLLVTLQCARSADGSQNPSAA